MATPSDGSHWFYYYIREQLVAIVALVVSGFALWISFRKDNREKERHRKEEAELLKLKSLRLIELQSNEAETTSQIAQLEAKKNADLESANARLMELREGHISVPNFPGPNEVAQKQQDQLSKAERRLASEKNAIFTEFDVARKRLEWQLKVIHHEMNSLKKDLGLEDKPPT